MMLLIVCLLIADTCAIDILGLSRLNDVIVVVQQVKHCVTSGGYTDRDLGD